MPKINADGCPIHVEVEGREDAPVLMLSNSLGATHRMWEPQVKAMTEHFRLVRYDRRGHGQSGLTKGPYSMEGLARDALAVIDGLGLQKVNWCGLSMGGMEGMWLGANVPERINRLILSNCTDHYADKTPWNDRIKLVREKGLKGIVAATMERWFTKDFRERSPDTIAWMTEMFLATPLDGYIACGEAVRDMDHRAFLPKIKPPTMIIAGRHDPAATPAVAENMRARIPGAKLTVLEAAHISNVERPREYNDALLTFLLQK
jgi:3-oxoadipate enol-lactonase